MSLDISELMSIDEYTEEVERHINRTLSMEEGKQVEESYHAGYSVHETISQLGLM